MVLSVLAAFVSAIGTEVEHIPHMGCPQILPGEELADQGLMVNSLVFFGIVTGIGVGVVPVQRLAAILGAADGLIRMLGMELVEPGAVVIQFAAVPAEVMVIADGVGDGNILVMGGGGGHGCHGGKSGLVHSVAEVIEHFVIVYKAFVRTCN